MTELPLETPGALRPTLAAGDLPVAFSDPVYLAAVVDLLGAIAYGEMSAFERLSEDAKMAPTLADKAELARMAVAPSSPTSRALQASGSPSSAPTRSRRWRRSSGPFDAFHARTAPSDWLEGLVKAYVGDGLAADFYREIAAFLDSGHPRDHPREPRGRRPVGVRRRPGPRRHRGGPPGRRPARAVGPPADGGGAVPGAAGRRRARRAGGAALRRRRPPGARPGRDRPAVHPAHREPLGQRMEKLGLSA